MSDIEIDKIRLGSQIKAIRLSLGMNQEQFGELFEPIANKSIISRWEKGQSIPSAERLKIISEVSNIPIKELIYGNLKDELFKNIASNDSEIEQIINSCLILNSSTKNLSVKDPKTGNLYNEENIIEEAINYNKKLLEYYKGLSKRIEIHNEIIQKIVSMVEGNIKYLKTLQST